MQWVFMGQLGESHPCFAAFWYRFHRRFNHLRPALLNRARGKVLEIGAGTGENLPFYPQVEQVTLTEPDPAMHTHAQQRLADNRFEFPVDVVLAAAETLPFPDHSVDTVVSTLVLCSVEKPVQAVAEICRILKPTGQLLFLEHTRAKHALAALFQDWLTPCQRRLAAGCRLNRTTLHTIETAGLSIKHLEKPYRWLPLYRGQAQQVT